MREYADDMEREWPGNEEDDSPTPPRRRRRFRFILALVILGALAFLALCVFLDIYGHIEQVRPADAIVILGARVTPNHRPGDSLSARTSKAVQLYRRGISRHIICTGGLGHFAPTEAQAAADFAMQQGVPENTLFLETTSTSTRENARNAAVICRKQGWKRVVVVSDPYHLWRARYLFAQEGLIAYPSPARTCLRNTNLKLRIIWTMREGAAVTKDAGISAITAVIAKLRR